MFYPFVMGISSQRQSGDRRDDIGDFAVCVERDPNWPVFCDDRDRLRAYIEAQGAGPLTLAALDQTYEEYLERIGHRLGDPNS
ncbi:MAG: YozE family protein [Kiloniellales bacterium]